MLWLEIIQQNAFTLKTSTVLQPSRILLKVLLDYKKIVIRSPSITFNVNKDSCSEYQTKIYYDQVHKTVS